MSRLNKAQDIIKLAMMFQNSYCGISIQDIQEEFETSRRSAERMKAVLFDMFASRIEEVPSNDNKKRWRFLKGTMNSLINFTSADFSNLEHLKEYETNPDRIKEIDELIAKIKALTPQKNIQSLETDISAILESEGLATRQHFQIKIDSKLLENLRFSMLSFKKIKFNYSIENNLKEITLNPYGVIILDRYYLVGFNEYVNDLRLYRIDKIEDLKIQDEYFEKDEKFSLKDFCANSFGIYQEEPIEITLIFDKSAKDDVLNYHFHPSQKIKVLKDDNVEVKIKCSGTYAICQELFKWGCSVKIKKPVEFKEYYKKYLSDVLKNQDN